MRTLAVDVLHHLLVSFRCIRLEVLEGEGGGNGSTDSCVGEKNDVLYDFVEMASATDLGI